MAHLSISLFGNFTVTRDGVPVDGFEYNKVRALLAYLAVESDRAHHREALAELLWPERPPGTARGNLRKTLSVLRRALAGETALIATRETVQFEPASDHSLDVAEFAQRLAACASHAHQTEAGCADCRRRLEQAADLYRGPLLDQFRLKDSAAFEAWQTARREALHRQALDALARLARACEAQEDPVAAVGCLRRQLELEPWHEEAHRGLMRLYARDGRRSAALAQYDLCVRALADELGVEPSGETQTLYEQLRTAAAPEISAYAPPAAPTGRNPFAARGMLKDPADFVGRRAELAGLLDRLRAMQCCSIVGSRRIGKSSLLYQLTQPAAHAPGLPDFDRYAFAYIDLQELAGAGPDEFCLAVVERLERASGGRLGVEPEADGTLAGMRRFLARSTDAGWKLVVGCDEFEMISRGPDWPGAFDADFFALLRGLCSNYNLALVTASQASLYDLCHVGRIQTSQFWNIFVEVPLGLMTEAEARRHIGRGGLSPEDHAFGLDLAGPHPFFLQIAGYLLFEARMAPGGPDYGRVERRFTAEARPHFAYAWEHLGEDDRQALRRLAASDQTAMEPSQFDRLLRTATVAGTAQRPKWPSRGWRDFVSSRAPL